MFAIGMIGLICAYILTVLLLLSINLYSNVSWKIKALSIVVATFFYGVSYQSFPPLLGWATKQELPERFRLVAADVQQPDKATGAKGAVFLWLKDLDDLSITAQPRAYQVEYSDQLYDLVIKAQSKIKKGMPQLGEFKKPDEDNVQIVEDLNRLGQEAFNIEFYDLPDPLIPEK